jgi:hypothetical protein
MKRGDMEKQRNPDALGIAGFTLGIMSLVMILLSPLFGILTALVGGSLCFVQLKKSKIKAAKIGLILNILGLVLNIALWVVLAVYLYPLIQSSGLSA